MKRESIGIGLLGLGVVGSSVAKALMEREEVLANQIGCPLTLRKILVRNLKKQRPVAVRPSLLSTEPKEVLTHPQVDVIVELIGGEQAALEYIKEALNRGKHVVTANKDVIAKHGPELMNLAQEHGVEIRYEASVGGGIPLIAPFQQDLIANRVSAIYAILNGTTNYILTRMAGEGLDFSASLKAAQELGYAEADPAKDIEGIDAAYKLAILAMLAFHVHIDPQDIYRQGISRLTRRDFRYAQELGYAIKLLAIARRDDHSVEVRVHPVLIPEDALLAKVQGVYNAVQVEGDLVGKVIFYGEGAGASPTSSAVIADIVAVAQRIHLGLRQSPKVQIDEVAVTKPMSEIDTRYYLRMNIADQPGVLAQIAKVLGDHLISISSVIQKETDPIAQTAEIVIMTHPAKERGMQQALAEMGNLAVVKEINNFIRLETL